MQNKKTLLKVEHLSFNYGNQPILEDISFNLYENDFLALIGPNGGGKSTLLRLISSLLPIQQGSIDLFDNRIGYVGQNTNINIHFPIKVIDVVMMGCKGNVFSKNKEALQKAHTLLEKVNMADFAQSKIGALSGGQRQRVMIARALFVEPDILLLDEPTSNIDADGVDQIYKLLKELNKELSIILVSHDLSILLNYATRVLHINKVATQHNLENMKRDLSSKSKHICEVELLEMLGRV